MTAPVTMTALDVAMECASEDLLTGPPAAFGQITGIGLLANATAKGLAGVAVVITLPDGRQVLGETTWRLLRNATRAMAAGPLGQLQAQLERDAER